MSMLQFYMMLICFAFACVSAETCETGSVKRADCNVCLCTSNQEWSCTEMKCGKPKTPAPAVPEPEETPAPARVCKVGSVKKDDCNTCLCKASGQWSCTEIKCKGAAPGLRGM